MTSIHHCSVVLLLDNTTISYICIQNAFFWHGNSKSSIVIFWIKMTNFLALRIARNIVIVVLSRNLMFTLLEIQGQKLSLCKLIQR